MGTTRQDDDDGNQNEEGDEDGKRAECGINTTLLPLKAFNFFYFGGEVLFLMGHWTRQKQISGLAFHLIFHRFPPFNFV